MAIYYDGDFMPPRKTSRHARDHGIPRCAPCWDLHRAEIRATVLVFDDLTGNYYLMCDTHARAVEIARQALNVHWKIVETDKTWRLE